MQGIVDKARARPQSAQPLLNRSGKGFGLNQNVEPQKEEMESDAAAARILARQSSVRKLSKAVSAASFASRLSLLKSTAGNKSAPTLPTKRRPRTAKPQKIKSHAELDKELRRLEGEITFLTCGQGVRDRDHLKLSSQHFTVKPGLVDFGLIRLGDTATRTFTIRNMGAAPCRIKILPIEDRNLIVKLGAAETRIAPGMREAIVLDYVGKTLCTIDLNLTIMAGKLEKFQLPIQGTVVEQIPEPFSPTDPDSLLSWIPRLPGSYFNWKTEEVVIEHNTQIYFDPGQPVDAIAAQNSRLRKQQVQSILPAYCVRVLDERRNHDLPNSRESEDILEPVKDEDREQLDSGIFTFLEGKSL